MHDESSHALRRGIWTLKPNMSAMGGAMLGLGTGAPAPVEYGTVGQSTIPLTTGDIVYWTVDLKELLIDTSRDIWVEPMLLSAETVAAASGATLDVHAKGMALGADLTDPTSGADANMQWTGVGATASQIFSAGKRAMLAPGAFAADEYLSIALTCTSDGGFSADALKLLGLRLHYTMMITDASGVRQET